MFVLSQDKKKFADYKKVYVSQQYNGKEKTTAFLFGKQTGFGLFGETIFWELMKPKKPLLRNWKISVPL